MLKPNPHHHRSHVTPPGAIVGLLAFAFMVLVAATPISLLKFTSDANANGYSLTNADDLVATNVVATNVSATNGYFDSVYATNGFTGSVAWSSLTGTPTNLLTIGSLTSTSSTVMIGQTGPNTYDLEVSGGGGGGSPGGSSGEMQYNSSGSFAGDPDFTTDGSGDISMTSFSSDGGLISSNGSGVLSLSGQNQGASINLGNLNDVADGFTWIWYIGSASYSETYGNPFFNKALVFQFTDSGPAQVVMSYDGGFRTTAGGAPIAGWDGSGNFFASTIQEASPAVPGSSSATGTAGQIAWDSNYIYICVASNTWKRAALSTW